MIPTLLLSTKQFTDEQAERLTEVMMTIQPTLDELSRCNDLLNKENHAKTMEFGGIICYTDTVLKAAGERRSTIINDIIKFLRTI
jgi:hypothetical protein